jgi:hypothetical protein
MHKNYEITELPERYFDEEATGKMMNEELTKMVNKYPAMFVGEHWDKYRKLTEEQEDDINK